MKSTLISDLTWSQPWFLRTVLAHFWDSLDLKTFHEVNLYFKVDFRIDHKSTLISKYSSCTVWNQGWFQRQLWNQPWFQKTTFIFYKWITSQCLTRKFWRGCEYYHLEWFSFHAISVAERAIFLTGWRFHTFASLLIITPEFHNTTWHQVVVNDIHLIDKSHSQALCWWCWAELLKGWRCNISHS